MPITYIHSLPGVSTRPPIVVAPRVPRLAVSALLDSTAESSVSIVQAPRGYGKTDALWAWASTTALGVEWLTLPRDAPIAQHISLFRSAVKRLNDAQYSLAPTRGTVLVVDGLAYLDREEIRSEVLALVDASGSNRLIFSTREPLPMGFLESRGLHGPLVMKADLEFSADETSLLAERLIDVVSEPLPVDTCESLRKATSGWPLGLRLALERARTQPVAAWSDVRNLTHHVAHDLVGELHQHAEYSSLIRAAVPDGFPESALSLLGDSTIIESAAHEGLGWWEREGAQRTFKFQPLIRLFLVDAASEDVRRQTLVGVARVHLRQGRIREAFSAAVRADDWALAEQCAVTDLIEVTALMSEDPRLLARVPKMVLRRVPLLNMLYALGLYIQGRTGSAMAAFGRMVAEVERTRLFSRADPKPEHVWLQGMITVGLRVLGRYELVRPALRRFIAMLELVTQKSSELDRAEDLFYTEAAVTMMQLADTSAAIEFLDRRPLRAARTKRQHFYGDALHLQALVAQGELHAARERLEEFEARVLPPHFSESFYAIPVHIAHAYLCLEAGEVSDAKAALAHTDRHWATAENWPFILLARTAVCWAEEGAQAALQKFTSLRAEQNGRANVSKPVEALFAAQQAQLLAATGRANDALSRMPVRSNEPTPGSTRSLLQLLTGAPSVALGEAEQVLQRKGRTVRHTLELHVISAAAAHRLSDERRRTHHVERAETLAVRSGLRAPFAIVGHTERPEVFAGATVLEELMAEVPAHFSAPAERPRLTKKELIALHELMQGASMVECAQRRSVSVNTVKSQRRALYRKLDVSRSSEAVQRARDLGLV